MPNAIYAVSFSVASDMDRQMELKHLAIAEKAVSEGERHILMEERQIAQLDRDGHDTTLARATLATFRSLQAEHIAHRNMLLKLLQEDATRPHLPDGPLYRPGYYDSNRRDEEGQQS